MLPKKAELLLFSEVCNVLTFQETLEEMTRMKLLNWVPTGEVVSEHGLKEVIRGYKVELGGYRFTTRVTVRPKEGRLDINSKTVYALTVAEIGSGRSVTFTTHKKTIPGKELRTFMGLDLFREIDPMMLVIRISRMVHDPIDPVQLKKDFLEAVPGLFSNR